MTVTVTNPGTVVEGYRLQVLGPLAPWAEVVPPEVSVYPQQEVTAAVVFSPPTGTGAPSGLQPFGVIARSTLDPQASAVAEGDIEIGQVFGLQAKIVPVTSAGRWRGRHVIQLSNWGNAPAQLRMTASDPDDAIGFYRQPRDRQPAARRPGVGAHHRRGPSIRSCAVRRCGCLSRSSASGWMRAPGRLRQPGMGYGDPSRPVVDAALSQKPILSKGLVTLMVLLLAGIIALIAYLQLRPETPEEPLAPRGAPPKPQLTATSVGPDSVGLTWTPVDLAEKYNLQHLDPKTDGVTKVDPLDGAVNIATVTGLKPETDVCFRLSVTRAGLTGPLSDKVCTRTAPPAPPTPTPTPTPPDTPTPTPTALRLPRRARLPPRSPPVIRTPTR